MTFGISVFEMIVEPCELKKHKNPNPRVEFNTGDIL